MSLSSLKLAVTFSEFGVINEAGTKLRFTASAVETGVTSATILTLEFRSHLQRNGADHF